MLIRLLKQPLATLTKIIGERKETYVFLPYFFLHHNVKKINLEITAKSSFEKLPVQRGTKTQDKSGVYVHVCMSACSVFKNWFRANQLLMIANPCKTSFICGCSYLLRDVLALFLAALNVESRAVHVADAFCRFLLSKQQAPIVRQRRGDLSLTNARKQKVWGTKATIVHPAEAE